MCLYCPQSQQLHYSLVVNKGMDYLRLWDDPTTAVQLSWKQRYGFPKIMGRSLETINSKFVMFVDNVESIPLK